MTIYLILLILSIGIICESSILIKRFFSSIVSCQIVLSCADFVSAESVLPSYGFCPPLQASDEVSVSVKSSRLGLGLKKMSVSNRGNILRALFMRCYF